MLMSCPCDSGLSKNVISQSDRSTRATCDAARPVKNDRESNMQFEARVNFVTVDGLWIFCCDVIYWNVSGS
jgi:hypothetical protein